jgi:hypothetical protein
MLAVHIRDTSKITRLYARFDIPAISVVGVSLKDLVAQRRLLKFRTLIFLKNLFELAHGRYGVWNTLGSV